MSKRAGGKGKRRLVILTEGLQSVFEAKTAVSVIRYRPKDVMCVLDRKSAGQDLKKLIGVGEGIPIVKSVKDALKLKPTHLLIGIAPTGGLLPKAWRKILVDAMKGGLDIISGLHTFMNDEPDLAAAAKRYKREIWDVRKPPDDLNVSRNIAKDTKCHRILTVGSDCNIGKMSVSLEMTAEAKRRGWDAEFVATGQTGIMITGSGLPIDRIISDFINGAAERLVMERKQRDWLFLEGQGSIGHPAYSAVTLGLLHGCAPDAMILCHYPKRKVTNGVETPIPPLNDLIELYQNLAKLICPSKIVGVGLNTYRMSDKAALQTVKRIEKETGLPATDVYRYGAGKLVDALDKHFKQKSTSKRKRR